MFKCRLLIILFAILLQFTMVAQRDSAVLAKLTEVYKEALLASEVGEMQKSIDLLAEIIPAYEKEEAWSDMIQTLQLETKNYAKLNDFESVDSVLLLCENLIDLHEVDNVDVEVQAFFLAGTSYHEKGLYQKSFHSLNRALDLFFGEKRTAYLDSLKVQSYSFGVRTNLIIGHIYNYAGYPLLAMGRYDEAINYFRAANLFYEKSKFPPNIYGSYINLGMAYSSIGDYGTAKKWLRKVIDKFEGNEDGVMYLAIAYSNFINVCRFEENYLLEAEYLEKQSKLLPHPSMKYLEGTTGTSLEVAYCSFLAKLALNHAHLNNCSQSLENAKLCLDSVLRIDKDVEIKALVLLDLGNARMKCNDIPSAIFYLDKGLSIINEKASSYKEIDKGKYLTIKRIEYLGLKSKACLKVGSR